MDVKLDGVYIFSTDTVYGLGTPLSNAEGIKRIFKIKGRHFNKPLAVLVADLAQADTLADWPTPLYRDPLEQLWPGGLTVVVPAKPSVSMVARAGFSTIGLRCPAHESLRALLKTHGPWVATSVNHSGEPPMTDEAQMRTKFQDQVDGFIFFDPQPNGEASTVVDLTVVPPKILRQGPQGIEAFLLMV